MHWIMKIGKFVWIYIIFFILGLVSMPINNYGVMLIFGTITLSRFGGVIALMCFFLPIFVFLIVFLIVCYMFRKKAIACGLLYYVGIFIIALVAVITPYWIFTRMA